MKGIASLSLALLLASTSAIKLDRAGFIDCEATGSCAPKKKSTVPKGFVGTVDMDTMYSFAEQDDARKEVAEAKQQIEARKAEQAKKDAETKSQWNDSVTSSKRGLTTEDKLAQKIAQEVLRDNAKLRGIHSGASIKHILEKEAKR